MPSEGEFRAQFRLLGDEVKGDVAAIQSKIASQLRTSGKGTPLSQVNRDLEANIAFGRGGGGGMTKISPKMLAAMSPEDRAWVLSRGSGGGGGGFKGKPPPILADLKAKMDMDRSKFIKDATFAMMPLFNPTSVWGNLFATRQIFSGLSQTKTGQGIVGRFGMGTGMGTTAAVAGGAVGILLAVGLSIKALAKVMHESIQAYKDAPKLYAKAMTSGLGLKFVTKQSMLSDIMGVSEQDVIKYGYAFSYLNPKIEWASAIMAKTNTNLTSVGWSFKIVDNDLKAMFATIANDAAPAMRQMAQGISEVIKLATEMYEKFGNPIVTVAGIGARGVSTMILGSAITSVLSSVIPALRIAGGKDPGAAPQPLSFMKQLPASSWEKMGLVIGGGGRNPAQETANNTKRLVEVTEAMYQKAICRPGGMSVFNPAQSYQ